MLNVQFKTKKRLEGRVRRAGTSYGSLWVVEFCEVSRIPRDFMKQILQRSWEIDWKTRVASHEPARPEFGHMVSTLFESKQLAGCHQLEFCVKGPGFGKVNCKTVLEGDLIFTWLLRVISIYCTSFGYGLFISFGKFGPIFSPKKPCTSYGLPPPSASAASRLFAGEVVRQGEGLRKDFALGCQERVAGRGELVGVGSDAWGRWIGEGC